MSRGFFAIGVYQPKTEGNIGTLMRTAYLYDAAYVFTVGRRYRRQATDTPNTALHIPLLNFTDVDDLVERLPYSTPLIGVELDPRSTDLRQYDHPHRGCYLLGAEDSGLPKDVIDRCHDLISLDSVRPFSMNVAVAGSIVLYDRHAKTAKPVPA